MTSDQISATQLMLMFSLAIIVLFVCQYNFQRVMSQESTQFTTYKISSSTVYVAHGSFTQGK